MELRFDALLEWSDWTSGRDEHAQAVASALRRLVGSRFRLRNVHLITSTSSGPAIIAALRDAGLSGEACRRIVPWLKPTMGLLSLRPDGDAMHEFVAAAVRLAEVAGHDAHDRRIGLDLETWIAPYYRGDETADWRVAGNHLYDAITRHDVVSCAVLHPTIQDHLPPSGDIRAGFFSGSSSRATRELYCYDPWGQWSHPKYRQPEAEAAWVAQNVLLRIRVRGAKRIVRPVSERESWTPSKHKPWYADEAGILCDADDPTLLSLPADATKLDEVCAAMSR